MNVAQIKVFSFSCTFYAFKIPTGQMMLNNLIHTFFNTTKLLSLLLVVGTFIHRQRIPMPPPNDDQFYNIYHFNINQQMVLLSRTFTVTNCDSFTRNFLTKLGVRLNNPAAVPDDPYSNLREQVGVRLRNCFFFVIQCFPFS